MLVFESGRGGESLEPHKAFLQCVEIERNVLALARFAQERGIAVGVQVDCRSGWSQVHDSATLADLSREHVTLTTGAGVRQVELKQIVQQMAQAAFANVHLLPVSYSDVRLRDRTFFLAMDPAGRVEMECCMENISQGIYVTATVIQPPPRPPSRIKPRPA